jgi:hypothetical protein
MALAGCGAPAQPAADADRDGVARVQELAGWNVTVESAERRTRHHVTSDPDLADTDGDGLLDFYEFVLSLDPRRKDTDGDGLTDCQEKRHTVVAVCEDAGYTGPTDGGYHTEADRVDSDVGQSRFLAQRPFHDETGSPAGPRLLGDGIPDGDEVNGYRVQLPGGAEKVVRTDPRSKDSDGDHLEDGEEAFLYGTDPTVQDTDGDGCTDGLDPVPERRERYLPGFRSFTWNGSQPARLRFTGVMANVAFTFPPGEPLSVRPGETVDLRGAAFPALGGGACSHPPHAPWVGIEIVAEWTDAPGGLRAVDMTSGSNPDAQRLVYWNVRTGARAWDAQGTRPAPASPWSGTDAVLDFAPSLTDSQGA